VHSLRARLFLTLAAACLIVSFSVAALSRQAAIRFWGPSAGDDTMELHPLDPEESVPPEFRLLEEAKQGFDRSMLVNLGIVLCAALVGTALLTVWVVRPIERLTRATAGLREGRVPVEGRGEVAQLARTLNELSEDVNRTEELRRRLLHDVSHELRTPLTAIRGKIEAMQDGLLQADAESLAALHANALHLGRIVDDLQELSLAEAGELRLERGSLDVGREVAALLASVAYECVDSEVGDVPTVLADQARLRQVLTNLLDNAVTHSPAGGRVRVGARSLDGMVEVSVHDEGSGIAAADLPHVFERFYRGDPARNRSTGGAGLGLAIARQLIEAQGGSIRAESEPGNGTTFRFTLPVASQA
jgi:two-component system sensor histidine kinase BaeS